VPVSIGILLNKYWGQFAEKHKKKLRWFDQIIILLIIYTSFCESFTERAFASFGALKLLLCAIGMLIVFFIVYYIISFISKMLCFNREDRITALFCGSKKSLVHGSVMSKVLFTNYTSAGIILLPIMMYHALQLIVVSTIARRIAKQSK
jgi:sodium/bile acid cotransporter 7